MSLLELSFRKKVVPRIAVRKGNSLRSLNHFEVDTAWNTHEDTPKIGLRTSLLEEEQSRLSYDEVPGLYLKNELSEMK